MISLVRGQAIAPSSPALYFISQVQGQMVPASALAFRILDVSSPDKENSGGTQVFPVSGFQAVDLVVDAIPFDSVAQNASETQGAGFYCARWTVPSDVTLIPCGRYQIEWKYTLTNPSSSTFTSINTEQPPVDAICRKTFEIINSASRPAGPQYGLVTLVREALGCKPEAVTDLRLLRLISLASQMIERVTGRYFDARTQVLRYGGNSSRKLQLNQPIVAVSSVGVDTQPTQAGDLVIDMNMLRIYNRHLSQGMLGGEDDRNNPKLEFVHSDDLYGVRFIPFRGISLRSLAWPIGVQNVHVRGVFGYTEPDGSPWGETPLLIQHALNLIVAREIPSISDTDGREDAQQRWRVVKDTAKDIAVQLDDPRKWGEWFGDPEIDSILASFVRPPSMGSV